jgi:hypothetical protein
MHSLSFEELFLSEILTELVRLEFEVRDVELKIKTRLLWKDLKRKKI